MELEIKGDANASPFIYGFIRHFLESKSTPFAVNSTLKDYIFLPIPSCPQEAFCI
jgi:hypothetical protein